MVEMFQFSRGITNWVAFEVSSCCLYSTIKREEKVGHDVSLDFHELYCKTLDFLTMNKNDYLFLKKNLKKIEINLPYEWSEQLMEPHIYHTSETKQKKRSIFYVVGEQSPNLARESRMN
jgi:hypothetical protein